MKKRTFTPVELLVVIAIIATLLAILACIETSERYGAQDNVHWNLKSIVFAYQSYLRDYDGWLPFSSNTMNPNVYFIKRHTYNIQKICIFVNLYNEFDLLFKVCGLYYADYKTERWPSG